MLAFGIAALLPYAVMGAISGGLLNILVWLIARRAQQWGQRTVMPFSAWTLPIVGAVLATLWAWASV